MGAMKDYAGLVASVLGSLTVVVGAAFWLKSLEDRVDRLEKQMQVIITAPAPKTGGSNPIQQTCADLAKRIADNGTGSTDSLNLKDLMDTLGCRRAGNP